MKTKAEKLWALYKGEKFITSGTIKEIAEETGKTFDGIMFLTYPAYKNRPDDGNKLQIYDIDEEEEDDD